MPRSYYSKQEASGAEHSESSRNLFKKEHFLLEDQSEFHSYSESEAAKLKESFQTLVRVRDSHESAISVHEIYQHESVTIKEIPSDEIDRTLFSEARTLYLPAGSKAPRSITIDVDSVHGSSQGGPDRSDFEQSFRVELEFHLPSQVWSLRLSDKNARALEDHLRSSFKTVVITFEDHQRRRPRY